MRSPDRFEPASRWLPLALSLLLAASASAAEGRVDLAALRAQRDFWAARGRVLDSAPATPPEWLAPDRSPEVLAADLEALRKLPPARLANARWTPVRFGEGSRLVTWSGNGRSLGWVSSPETPGAVVRVWPLGKKVWETPLERRWDWVDSLALDDEGVLAAVGLHDLEPGRDAYEHQLMAIDGPVHALASFDDSPDLRHGVATFAGDLYFVIHARLEENRLTAWPAPRDVRAAWITPSFDDRAVNLSRMGTPYHVATPVASRLARPGFAAGPGRIFMALGIDDPGARDGQPVLVVRGLPPHLAKPAVFSGEEDPGALRFRVPGSPLSLSPAHDGRLFAYSSGRAPVRSTVRGRTETVTRVEDGALAMDGRGFHLLREDGSSTFLPSPAGQVCQEVTWRPGGLEVAISMDWDDDGALDLVIWDPGEVVRDFRQERERSALATAEEKRRMADAARRAEEERRQQEARRKAEAEERRAQAETRRKAYEAAITAARQALERRDPEATRRLVGEAVGLDPGAPEPHLILATLELVAGDVKAAREALAGSERCGGNRGATGDRHHALFLLALGLEKLGKGQISPGLKTLDESVDTWSAAANPAWSRLCQEALERKLFTLGIERADRWRAAGSDRPASLVRVPLLLGLGRGAEAVEAARTLVDRDAFDATAKALLGDALLATGRVAEASALYQEAKALAPGLDGIAGRLERARAAAAPAAAPPARPPAPGPGACPRCRAPTGTADRFCSQCGTSLVHARTCGRCGRELLSDQRFCPLDGTPAP